MVKLKKAAQSFVAASAFFAIASSANATKLIVIEKLCQDSISVMCSDALPETFKFTVRSGSATDYDIEVLMGASQGQQTVEVTDFQGFGNWSLVFEDENLPENWKFVGATAFVNSAPHLGTTASCGIEVTGQEGNFSGCRIDWADAENPDLDETVTLTYVNTPVPLPASAWMLGSALLGLAGVARRRRA